MNENKYLEKIALLSIPAGAIASTEGHRWGGAGAGAVGGFLGHNIGGAVGGVKGAIIGDLVGGALAGHAYGKHAAKNDLSKKISDKIQTAKAFKEAGL